MVTLSTSAAAAKEAVTIKDKPSQPICLTGGRSELCKQIDP